MEPTSSKGDSKQSVVCKAKSVRRGGEAASSPLAVVELDDEDDSPRSIYLSTEAEKVYAPSDMKKNLIATGRLWRKGRHEHMSTSNLRQPPSPPLALARLPLRCWSSRRRTGRSSTASGARSFYRRRSIGRGPVFVRVAMRVAAAASYTDDGRRETADVGRRSNYVGASHTMLRYPYENAVRLA